MPIKFKILKYNWNCDDFQCFKLTIHVTAWIWMTGQMVQDLTIIPNNISDHSKIEEMKLTLV